MAQSVPAARLNPLRWIAVIWCGFGFVDAIQTVLVMHAEGMHHAWILLFLTTWLSWLPWAAATPLIMQLARSHPLTRQSAFRRGTLHLAACLTIGLVFVAWTAGLESLFNPYADPVVPPFLGQWLDHFSNGILSFLVLYGSVLAIKHLLDSRDRLACQQVESALLSEKLLKAQLEALRRQIEPHFLFNTLNALAALVREGRNQAAVNMIARLSDFLRRSLADGIGQEVPLKQEIEFTRQYLELQMLRFADRLQVCIDIPAELDGAQVPFLLLQPLVENAFKHGIAKRAQGGWIKILGLHSHQTLTLSVYNDGPPLKAGEVDFESGIGLSNLRARLQGLYGSAFRMTIGNAEPAGVAVRVTLPLSA